MTANAISMLIGAVIGFVIGALVMRKHYQRIKSVEDQIRNVEV